ncbi:MAG TPA: DUF4296 domain-containing protein [Chryseosolibacter sp.]
MKGFIKIKNVFFAAVIGFSALLSCSKPEEKRPDYILTQEQMVEALAEVYIAEQKVQRLTLNTDTAAAIFGTMEKKVFQNLNIPDSVFRASFDYYMDHPIEMEMIYAALVDSLQLREQRVTRQAPQ